MCTSLSLINSAVMHFSPTVRLAVCNLLHCHFSQASSFSFFFPSVSGRGISKTPYIMSMLFTSQLLHFLRKTPWVLNILPNPYFFTLKIAYEPRRKTEEEKKNKKKTSNKKQTNQEQKSSAVLSHLTFTKQGSVMTLLASITSTAV